MGQYLGYDPRMAICGIVALPVLIWWLKVEAANKVKWFGYLMILFFVHGSIELAHVIYTTILRYIFELPILYLYFTSYKQYGYAGRGLVIPFILVSLVSSIQTSPLMWVLFLLYFLEIFMLFIYFRNNYEGEDATLLHKLFWLLACSQIPTAIIKYFMVGVTEPYIGSMSSHEGGITTVFSLVMYCYALEMYFCTKERKYLFALLGFILFGIVGAKRALAFLFPAFYFVVLIVHSLCTHSIVRNSKKMTYGVICMPILFVLLCILNPSFNPEKKVGGSFDLKYVIEYSGKYNNGGFGGDDKAGRANAMAIIHEKMLNDNLPHQLFGYGSGLLISSSFNSQKMDSYAKMKVFGVGYSMGIGYLTLLAQVGFMGVIPYFLIFILSLIDLLRKTKAMSPYMTQTEIGLCVSAILTLICIITLSFFYNNTSFFFNCASVLNMWFIAYAYITLDKVKERITA